MARLQFTVIIILMLAGFAEAGVITITPKGQTAPKQSAPDKDDKAESALIEEGNWENCFLLKVTTSRQRRFDCDGDGYLNKMELTAYMKHYRR